MRSKKVAGAVVLALSGAMLMTGSHIVKAEGNAKELTVWCWDPSFNIYAMQEAEKVYNEANPDDQIKLKIVETPWDDLQTKISTLATSNKLDEMPDIFLVQDNAFQKNCKLYPDAFADLSGYDIDFKDFAKSKVGYSVLDGKNYGVPFDNGTCVNAVRIDYLKEAGYTVDDLKNITWDKYIEIGKKVKEKTGKTMMSSAAGSPDLPMMILQSASTSLFKEDGGLNIEGNKVLEDTMELYKKLVDEGVLKEVNNWDEYTGDMNKGNVASVINGCWILGSIQNDKEQSGKWEIVDLPKLYADDEKSTNYSNNGGSSWAVSGTSKNKDLAAKFLKATFASSVDLYNTILPKSGAVATFLPAVKAPEYGKPQAFFNDQKVFEDILNFAEKVPAIVPGVYYYEARDAVGQAVTKYVKDGGKLQDLIKEANEQVQFKMDE